MKKYNKDILPYITRSVLFSGLKKSQLTKIVSLVKQRFYSKGDKIITESSYGKDIYFIISGKVVVYLEESSKKKIIDYLSSGNVLGEIGLFTGKRSATCECVEPTIVGIIKYKDFYNLIAKNTNIAMNIIKILVKRLFLADQEIKNLVFKPVLARVCETLIEFLDRNNEIKISVNEISAKVGANRETVSRIISLLEKLNYLTRFSNKLKVLNKEKLVLLAQK
jgi:CRP/FNR family transcriptional regulator